MAFHFAKLRHRALEDPRLGFAEDLERGQVLTMTPCPFPLPKPADRAFLLEQRLKTSWRPDIFFELDTQRVRGVARPEPGQLARLRTIFAACADEATRWLSRFPYQSAAQFDYIAFHPEEEATRTLGPAERNDLLHLDASRRGPSLGRRLLRLFVNLHPTDPRVWLTSVSFAELLQRYRSQWELALQRRTWWHSLQHGFRRLFQEKHSSACLYDDFHAELRTLVRRDEEFQERAPKKCWHFPPDTAWLAFTDGLCHAELRGRFVLEFAWFIPLDSLVCPALAPSAQFQRAFATLNTARAA